MEEYDIIVVGAGPAGSAAAEKCARYGLNTLLLEKEKLPRDKPCGGMIGKISIDYLTEIYGQEIKKFVERKTDFLKLHFNNKQIADKKLPAYMFSRKKLDYFITSKAIEAGAEVIDNCKIDDIETYKDKVIIKGENNIFSSKIVIGADGVNGIVSKKTGLNPGWNQKDLLIAIETEISIDNKEIVKRFGN